MTNSFSRLADMAPVYEPVLPSPPPAYIRAQNVTNTPDFTSVFNELEMERNKLAKDSQSYRNIGGFLLLCVFLVVVCSNHYYEKTSGVEFSVRWPAADCAMNSSRCDPKLASKNIWFISGFSPMRSNRTCEMYCSSKVFNESELVTIKADLEIFWPNTAASNNPEHNLWAQVWHKHGTCTSLGQFEYFSRALSLYSCYKFADWLRDAGIIATNSHAYLASQVKKAISDRLLLKTAFALHCEWRSGVQYLSEISLCVAENGRTLMPCHAAVASNTCGHEFFYASP